MCYYYCVVVAMNCMENSDSIFSHADTRTSSLFYDLQNYLSSAIWEIIDRKPPFNYRSTVKGAGRKGWGVEV